MADTAASGPGNRVPACVLETADLRSEAEQSREFHNESTVFQHREPARCECGVALIVVDDKELAPRAVLPAQSEVGAQRASGGVVLHQAAEKHPRRKGVGET